MRYYDFLLGSNSFSLARAARAADDQSLRAGRQSVKLSFLAPIRRNSVLPLYEFNRLA